MVNYKRLIRLDVEIKSRTVVIVSILNYFNGRVDSMLSNKITGRHGEEVPNDNGSGKWC